ncbi:MAG: hypothetical protein IIU30_03830 [Treponema sp.]|nr:hypothetical protein [Treponema sp.]MBQ5432567.1 hypothetical protein [Treponema sp.]
MKMAECKESDWKLFRVKIIDWQENYMTRLNQKIIKILSDENKTQSDRFWKASKILASEKKSVGVVCELKRSMLNWNIVSLINQKVITMDDLSDFSSELQEHIALMMRG